MSTVIKPPSVYVKETSTKVGRGVFAGKAFVEGEVVEVAPVLPLGVSHDKLPHGIKQRTFAWGFLTGQRQPTEAIAFGYASMYNSANPANMRYEGDSASSALRFIAVRGIERDEELTINYSAIGGGPLSPDDAWFERNDVRPVQRSAKTTKLPRPAPTRPTEQIDSVVARLIEAKNLEIRRFFRFNIQPRFKQFLYKYRVVDHSSQESMTRLRTTIVDSQLWLSSPADFNDPFDHAVKVVADATAEERRAHHERLIDNQAGPISKEKRIEVLAAMLARPSDEAAATMQQIVMQNALSNGVHSFGGEPRNLQMWSYYGNEHRGICFQFDIAQDPANLIHVVDAEYSEEYPHFNCFRDSGPQVAPIIVRKHTGWIHEDERRLILPDGARSLLRFDPKALSAVIFGCRIEERNRTAILGLLRERAERGHAKPRLFQAVQHDSSYKVVLRRVRVPGLAR